MMDFDERRIDLVKTSIKNVNSGQKIVSKVLDNKIHVHWPKEDEYLGNESIYDHLTCDDANWNYEYDGVEEIDRIVSGDGQVPAGSEVETEKVRVVKLKVKTGKDEEPLIDLALNNPEPHIRIAAINKLYSPRILTMIIVNDEEDSEVKKACLNRLNELYID